MTQRLYIQLGKAGDILSLLPLLWLDAQKGERSALMVAKDYAPILEGCSYLDPVIFDGDPHELARAHAEAVATGKEVICCQVNGPPEQVAALTYGSRGLNHATTESFQKESWKIAGRLNEWRDQPPLVFDKRSPEREAELLKFWPKNKKVILVSLAGSTSPFPFKDLLHELLRLKFAKGYQIIDLANIRAERFYDLLTLYEKAHCLVTDDSAPLHLAYACKTLPVVALINDRTSPDYHGGGSTFSSLWHGSCWRPNHIFHCRYRDFPKRSVAMIASISSIGAPGSWFCKTRSSPTIIHAVSQYETSEDNFSRHAEAITSWEREWNNGHWICSWISLGIVGRDSAHSALKDSKRFPYVQDVLSLACLRANPDDLICLTRCDTAFSPGITEALIANAPCFHHRRLANPDTHHPAVDLFCFTKKWWLEHKDEYPSSMVMGLDHHWHRILMELVKKHGGKELKGCVYRAHPQAAQRIGDVPKYIQHNETLARAWLDKNSTAYLVKPVHKQLPTVPLNRRALHPFGYNPSIIRFGDRLLMAYRWHDGGNASTALAMAELDKDFNVTSNKEIEVPRDQYASHEDGRLFLFQGALHISYVCSKYPSELKSVVRYGRLEDGVNWKVVDVVQPDICGGDHGQDYGGNQGLDIQKNWLFFQEPGNGGELQAIVHTSPEQVLWYLRKSGHTGYPSSDGKSHWTSTMRQASFCWPWGVPRGGTTPLPYKGNLISFFHSRLDNEPAPYYWRYAVGARIIESKPPFATLAVSKEPVLRSSEQSELSATELSSCFHGKPNVVFPAGAMEIDGGWIVSCGVNDASCVLVKVSEKDLNL